MEFLLLLVMVFCHIVDDFYLQPGMLSQLKQKSFWEENAPDEMYKYDYLMALFIHSFSWAFMVMIAPFIYIIINDKSFLTSAIIVFFFELAVHFYVDNLKANKKKIDLVTDQLIHLFQIISVWSACVKYI